MNKIKKNKKYLALILARKNSQRLKNKNVKVLGKKPLINITLDNLNKIRHLFVDILVSSDSKLIEKHAREKKVVFIKRPKKLSLSKTSSEESAIDAVKKYEKKFSKVDYVVLFQVTSPFRKNSSIIKILETSKKYPKDQIVTTSDKFKKNPNGVLYLTPKKTLFTKKKFAFNKKYRILLTKSEKESLDIDTMDDFELARKYLKN